MEEFKSLLTTYLSVLEATQKANKIKDKKVDTVLTAIKTFLK